MKCAKRTEIFNCRRMVVVLSILFVLVLGPAHLAPARQKQGSDHGIRIFDGKPKTIIVNGYSTSFHWPSLLQKELDEMHGGKRVLTVIPATKGGTPIAKWMDVETGKPLKTPGEFYIDTDICMNCGSCAEFCPFDAIKMDHDFELADYDRTEAHIHNLQRLSKPVEYYAKIRPTYRAAEIEAERAKAERAARAKAARSKSAEGD